MLIKVKNTPFTSFWAYQGLFLKTKKNHFCPLLTACHQAQSWENLPNNVGFGPEMTNFPNFGHNKNVP